MAEKAINPQRLTVEVMDLDGKNHKLTGRVVARKELKEFNRVMFEESLERPVEEQGAFQAAYIYETDLSFWDNFDTRVITRAVTVFVNDLRNPTT